MITTKARARIFATAVASLLLAGCLSAPSPDAGGGDVRFHNWWNFYERGVSRLRDGQVDAAREDFERSLGLKPGAKFGNTEDALRVRTYGVHMLDGYFPNRELGICLYLSGQTEDAISYLAKSLEQASTGRGRYYLNLARRDELARRAVAGPSVALAPKNVSEWTKAQFAILAGTARAPARVAGLSINGADRFVELADAELPFREEVTLREGTNVVPVVARDLLGREARTNATWLVDWHPPELVITSAKESNGAWQVEGYCRDDRELASLTLGERPEHPAPGTRRLDVRVSLAAGEALAVLAEDRAGNRLQTAVSTDALARDWADAREWRLASAGTDMIAPGAENTDRKRPVLSLSASSASPTVVYHDRFFLDGVARDRGGLKSLTVLGEPQLAADERGCIEKHFSSLVDLDPGTNVVWVSACDAAGNCATQQVVLVRCSADYLKEEYRLTVAMPPLANPDQDPAAIRAHLAINGRIRNPPVRFRLLERNEGWEAVLREQQLSLSALADRAVQLKVGRVLPAELIFLGDLLHEGRGTTLRIRVVETRQGEELFTEDVYSEDLGRDLLYQSEGLIMKIKQRLPLVDGRVAKTDGDRVILDVGALRGVLPGSRFIVARPAGPDADPASAQVVRPAADQFVQLAVTELREASATAIIEPDRSGDLVRAGDVVFAR